MYTNNSIPTIIIYIDTEMDNYKEILWGIEEESVPYEMIEEVFVDPIAQAYRASQESSLEIGIAYNQKGLVIHDKKLPQDYPMFITTTFDKKICRIYGNNAARLVKGLPMIEID